MKKNTNKLVFENIDKNVLKEHTRSFRNINNSIEEDKLKLTIQNWIEYFYQYKLYILSGLFIIPLCCAVLLQNKHFKASIGFKIEVGQNFTTNILSESLLGRQKPSGSIGDITERALVMAKSKNFYQKLAKIIYNEKEYNYVRFKFLDQKKSWLVWIKKNILKSDEGPIDRNEKLLRIADLLEKTITIKGSVEDHNIFFNIKTKNKNLTESIQKLIKSRAGKIMISRPLNEAKNALEILKEREKEVFSEIESVESKLLGLQKEYKTLLPKDLPKRYSIMRLEIDKQILKLKLEINNLEEKQKAFTLKTKSLNIVDYNAINSLDEIKREIKAKRANYKLLLQRSRKLERKYQKLPELSAKVQKLDLKKAILLEKLKDITAQITLANIFYQKIKGSLTDLNSDEDIIATSMVTIITRVLVLSIFTYSLLIAFYYYKQMVFPVVMQKETLSQTQIPIVSSFSRGRYFGKEKYEFEHIHPRRLAIKEFYKNHMKQGKIFIFSSISKKFSHTKDLKDVFHTILGDNKRIKVIDLEKTLCTKGLIKSFKKKYKYNFSYIELHKRTRNEIINQKYISRLINEGDDYDYVFVLASNISRNPDALLISKYADTCFILSKLFEVKISQLKTFTDKFNQLPRALRKNFSFVLTNALPYDDIELFLNSEQKDSIKRPIYDHYKTTHKKAS